jgi:hypothetical protein
MEYSNGSRGFTPRKRARQARLLGALVLGVAGVAVARRLMRARASEAEPARRDGVSEDVDEASDESFPASDPPSFTPSHPGSPDHHEGGGGGEREEDQ